MDDPVGQLGVAGVDAVAVCFEEGEHGDEGESLVAVDERPGFGDAVREHGGLECEVGVLVVGVGCRPGECAFEARAGAEMTAASSVVPPAIAA